MVFQRIHELRIQYIQTGAKKNSVINCSWASNKSFEDADLNLKAWGKKSTFLYTFSNELLKITKFIKVFHCLKKKYFLHKIQSKWECILRRKTDHRGEKRSLNSTGGGENIDKKPKIILYKALTFLCWYLREKVIQKKKKV